MKDSLKRRVGFGFFGGQHDHLTGEPVAGGVEGGFALGFFGAGTGGVLGVLLIGGCLCRCGHFGVAPFRVDCGMGAREIRGVGRQSQQVNFI
jgi:hypothetical protein